MLGSTLLTALKEELGFWEKGGYGYKFRSAWRPTLVLRDSPICFNAMAADARSCRECLLADLVPPEKRNLSLPCHHIPLNQAGDTIAGLYINGTQDKLDQTFLGWLRSTIEKLEESEVSAMKALECTTAISFKNILFLTDFSPASEAAYTYAVALARHFGARVYPAHALAPFVPTEMEVPISPEIFAQAEEQGLQKLIDLFEPAKVPYEPLVTQGLVEIVVQDWIKEHGIDLIVMGTHGRKGFNRFFLGSTAEAIFRTVPCPVLTVGPHASPKPFDELDIHKVLLAISLSKKNDPAAAYALSFAREEKADLTVLHVLEAGAETVEEWSMLADDARRNLKGLIPVDGRPGTAFFVEAGDPAKTILEYANNLRPGLVVMGVSEKAKSSTHFLRGVAYKVISSAPCAVLTIRQEQL